MPPAPTDSEKQAAAHNAVDILHEISIILNCHLDRRILSICISMIENGVNPEALANVIHYLRKEAQKEKFRGIEEKRQREGGQSSQDG